MTCPGECSAHAGEACAFGSCWVAWSLPHRFISVNRSSSLGSVNTSVTDFCGCLDEIGRLVPNFHLSGYHLIEHELYDHSFSLYNENFISFLILQGRHLKVCH